jgi:hypothetical protein
MNNQKLLRQVFFLFACMVLTCSMVNSIGQTVYNFTNAGASGVTGPTQAQANSAYSATSLNGQVTITGAGIQQWVVPATGIYNITTAGASGGYTPSAAGGKGRVITTQVSLVAGQVLNILVGQEGGRAQFGGTYGGGYCGGGGGGSFVVNQTTSSILLISGGGGGAGEGSPSFSSIQPGVDAAAYNVTSGTNGIGYSGSWSTAGVGGTGGSGGTTGSGGSGGSGYSGNGALGGYGGNIGANYLNGGTGGTNRDICGQGFITNIPGGFGAGSGAGICYAYEANGGGGGGYSGGGGSNTRVGAGGGGGNFIAASSTYISSVYSRNCPKF